MVKKKIIFQNNAIILFYLNYRMLKKLKNLNLKKKKLKKMIKNITRFLLNFNKIFNVFKSYNYFYFYFAFLAEKKFQKIIALIS